MTPRATRLPRAPSRTRPTSAAALRLAVPVSLLLGAACADAGDGELRGAAPPDAAADTLPWLPDDTVVLSPDVPTAAPGAAGEPRPMPLPQIEAPVAAPGGAVRPVRDTTRVVQAVFGRAEIAFDARTFAPADYMSVSLEGGRRRFEALSDAGGSFFFENVPPGRYELVVRTATKDQRVVWRVPASISGTGKFDLPVIHIPIDSIRTPRG